VIHRCAETAMLLSLLRTAQWNMVAIPIWGKQTVW